MACRLFDTKPLSGPMLGYCQLEPHEQNFSEILTKLQNFSFVKMHLKKIDCEMAAILSREDELMLVLSIITETVIVSDDMKKVGI